jgi:hypothetical protein
MLVKLANGNTLRLDDGATPEQVRAAIVEADEFLSSPERWHKGEYGLVREEGGEARPIIGSQNCEDFWSAECLCLEGALERGARCDFQVYAGAADVVREAMAEKDEELPALAGGRLYNVLHMFNDYPDTTFEHVKTVISRARELAAEMTEY